jgi:tripartite-type tricarboxylate transporter receptor subunit TctC
VLMAPSAILATNQWLYKEMPYDPQKDLFPVINAATTPNMMVVHPDVRASNVKELIALAKAKPGALSFASGGNGTTSHLCGELLKTSAQIDLVHVPYKGPAPAAQDVRAGRLRPIALTAMTRHPQAPDVPTADESGLPGFEVSVWYGFAVQAATPRPVVEKLNAEIAKALRNPATRERLDSLGLAIVADSPEEFARFVAAESAKMRKLVQASGARVD